VGLSEDDIGIHTGMNKKSTSSPSRRSQGKSAPVKHRPVPFTLQDPRATQVFIAGTFNDWHPSATPMVAVGDGRWIKTLELEPGTHEYLFVIDGRWVADPGSAITVPNPFGGINCCVNVR
jgi:1,4-alpha-glucan branching enzyme